MLSQCHHLPQFKVNHRMCRFLPLPPLMDPKQVENMLALGPFPRFASTMVKNIETSWRKVVEGYGIEDTGGA